MPRPLDRPPASQPELVLLTTDRASGAVACAVSLGNEWERLLCDMVLDAGRRAQQGRGA